MSKTLQDHTEGFRQSPEYDGCREILPRFYDPVPHVEHYETILDQPADIARLSLRAVTAKTGGYKLSTEVA